MGEHIYRKAATLCEYQTENRVPVSRRVRQTVSRYLNEGCVSAGAA